MYREIINQPINVGDIVAFNTYSGSLEIAVVHKIEDEPDGHRGARGYIPGILKVHKLYDKPIYGENGRFTGYVKDSRRATVNHKEVVKIDKTLYFLSDISDENKAIVNRKIEESIVNVQRNI